ncbi:MAG: hypothetical protein HY238_00720 [Acidobacteria bacterium]|nr:hypothetical protein [Acidobacteriota bacterium]
MNVTDVAAIVGVFSIPIVALIVLYLTRRLQSQERIKAIEKGVNIPFEPIDPKERALRTRRAGIILVTFGLGLIIFSVVGARVEQDKDMLIIAGGAAIPLLIGLGLLYDYRLRMREISGS